MAISIERYVDITSGVIGAQAVAERELVGLRFTTDTKVPTDKVVTIENQADAISLFGSASDESKFAGIYFGYISPAPVSQASKMRFAAWADVARAARIYGAEKAFTVGTFTPVVDGAINLTIGAYQTTVTGITLAAVVTLADVASAIQVAIRAETGGGIDWTGATVTYNATESSFELVGGQAGNASIAVGVAATGTDLAPLIGWSDASAILSPGADAEDPLDALLRLEQITDSFGSFSYGATIDDAQALAVAQYNAGLNVKYQFYVSVTLADYSTYSAALTGIQSCGLILNETAGQFKEALPAAIMAATNYRRRNAAVNYMYRTGPGLTADVSTNALANALDALRVNYYGETANAGQKISFFQRAFLQGLATSPLDMAVHANEQWLKAFLTARLLSLQLTLGRIPANDEGRGLVMAQVMEGVDLAKFNGTILIGKRLTTAQQLAVTQLTGDTEAWRDVQTNGFWLDVEIVESTVQSGATEYTAQYTLAYAKGDVVRKIEGSHNLL